jgi:hypothetical protein
MPHLGKIAATGGYDEVPNSQDMPIAQVTPGAARQLHSVAAAPEVISQAWPGNRIQVTR